MFYFSFKSLQIDSFIKYLVNIGRMKVIKFYLIRKLF